MSELYKHKSVLVEEVLEYLQPQAGKVYVDTTFGGGGHTRAILEKEPGCRVIGIDWDPAALQQGQNLQQIYGERLELWSGNFAKILMLMKKFKIPKVDGVLADFGTSQNQIFTASGFSVHRDSFLDMRMSSGHYRVNAAEVVNKATESELAQIFFELGEETAARKIAKVIAAERKIKPIKTTGQLVDLVIKVKGPQRGPIHPATKVFQALRMYVNHELENISSFLHVVDKILQPGGRVVCISFHSLEDRLVKHFFKEANQVKKGQFEILTSKPVTASIAELQSNPSARSARLRAAIYNGSSIF